MLDLEVAISNKDIPSLKKILTKLRLSKKDLSLIVRCLTALSVFDTYSNAVHYLKEAYTYDPNDISVLNNLGFIYHKELCQYSDAMSYYKRCIELGCSIPEVFLGIADLCDCLNLQKDKLKYVDIGLQRCPDNCDLINIKGLLEFDLYRKPFEEIVNIFKKGLCLTTNPEIKNKILLNIGHLYGSIGSYEQCILYYLEAISYSKTDKKAYQNLLFNLHYFYEVNETLLKIMDKFDINQKSNDVPEIIKSLHEKCSYLMYNCCLEEIELKPKPLVSSRAFLNIGYVGADFHGHAVSNFTSFINKTKFKTFIYSTKYYKNVDFEYKYVADKNTEQLYQLIIDDNIDILIDLSGYTSGNRLDVFALSVLKNDHIKKYSFIGYPNNVGFIPRISDKYTEKNSINSNKNLLFSDIFLYYKPISGHNGIASQRHASDIVFGCFAKLSKINNKVIETFSIILEQKPNSKLILKSKYFSDPSIKNIWSIKFPENVRKRVLLLRASATTEEHMSMFNLIDLHLDTFPYSGTTITMEALHMAVPVITVDIQGSHLNRVTGSILKSQNLEKYIATSIEDYINKAVNFIPESFTIVQNHEKYIQNFENLFNP